MAKIDNVRQIEAGIYQDARAANMVFTDYVQYLADNGDISNDLYDPEAKDKDGKHISATRQLIHAAGIRTRGTNAQTVQEGFYSDPANRVLFPAFLSDRFRDLEKLPDDELQLDDLVLVKQPITSGAYRYAVLGRDTAEQESSPSRKPEGAEMQVYRVTYSDKSINMETHGGIIRMTYEVLARLAIPALDRFLSRVARQTMRAKVNRALAVILNGEPNNGNPSADRAVAATSFAFTDLINLKMDARKRGAAPTLLIAAADEVAAILSLDVVALAASTALAAAYRDNGEFPTIQGLKLKITPPNSVFDNSKKIAAFDPALGLEMAYEPALELVETDRLISGGFNEIAIRDSTGFGKPDTDCAFTATHT